MLFAVILTVMKDKEAVGLVMYDYKYRFFQPLNS